jgi:alanine racemase
MSEPRLSVVSATATPIPRVFRPQRTVPTDVVRPTRAEISLPNLRFNLQRLQRRTKQPVWCVLKADAYGHGAKACARTLERAGAAGLCVALLEEGIELRNAGATLPILIMSGHYGRAWSELLSHQLTPVLYDPAQIAELAAEVRFRGSDPVPVHIKVDTGMGRLGVLPKDLAKVAEALVRYPEVQLDGLMTHFACADTSLQSIHEQLAKFDAVTALLRARGVVPARRHAANTAALLSCPEAHLDLVRPGIGIFGVEPVSEMAPELRPVMRVQSTVIALRDLEAGATVGYGATWTAPHSSVVATIPMGYADGITRSEANRGEVLVRGCRCPIVGAVSMDMTTIDVTHVPGAALGDEVVILGEQSGPQGVERITAGQIAAAQGTIAWEVLTGISKRVPRFYRGA